MNTSDHMIIEIATAIWRSGYMKDKNKVRQKAKEDMRRLIAFNIASSLQGIVPAYKIKVFLEGCNLDGFYKTK